jgi:hypothetical protein
MVTSAQKGAPINLNLRANNNNELTLSVRCDDPETMRMVANWLNHEVEGLKSLSEIPETEIIVNQDSQFSRIRAA